MDSIPLLPDFGSLGFTLLAFLIALTVIVAVHEYGHYIVGRWSGIKAEVFSIGFGPVLFSRTDRRGTRWQFAALPLGGYVKFLGDGDAASVTHRRADIGGDGEAAPDGAARRATMQGAPLWARAATVAAGPAFNFVLAVVIFAGVFLWQGRPADPLMIETVRTEEAGGLQPGDRVIAIEGNDATSVAALSEAQEALPLRATLSYTVERDGERREVQAPYPYPPLVEGLTPRSAAIDVGLQLGDLITAVDGQPIFAFGQLQDAVAAAEGGTLTLSVLRDGRDLTFTLAPRRMDLPLPGGGFEARYLVGITGGLLFEPATVSPGPLDALWGGVVQTWTIINASLSGLYHMAAGAISSCNLSGPIGIAETSGAAASQGVETFIWFIAVLSTAVGLLNLFPIPVLDGGHLMFHAYEAVRGRPPSEAALRVAMAAGVTLMLGLMVFAVGNDLFCP